MSDRGEQPRLFAVVGRPVLHSRSPDMFGAAFEQLGLRACYTRLAADSAAEAIRMAGELQLSGLNVTSPYKHDVLDLVQPADEASRRLGAVNTIVEDQGVLRVYNTDWQGVLGALRDAGVDPRGQKAVVLGAGGAGRAAAFALASAGAREVVIVNRGTARAREAAGRLGCAWAPLDDLKGLLVGAGLLVSCLSAGVSVVEPAWLGPHLTVLDADYAGSTLNEHARERGCKVVHGLDWLLHQALAGFELFLRCEAPAQPMRDALAAVRSRPSNIALVGFMGTGKTTVGRLVADGLGLTFEDTDETIERITRKNIPDIFAERGEAGFRRQEKTVLERIEGAERTVFACGGGAVLDEDNRRLLRRNCTVVWLWAPAALCLSRAGDGSRPLLATADPAGKAREMLEARRPSYAECADLVLGVADRTAEAAAGKICDEVRGLEQD